jgi:hypothetical protein
MIFFIPKALVGKPIESCKFEVTRESDHKVVAAIPYAPFGHDETYPLGFATSPFTFDETPPALKALPDDTYTVAITTGGRRCSNAAQLVLDYGADRTDLPVLELVALEPPPFYHLSMLGVRVNASKAFTGGLISYMDICNPVLIVDDVRRKMQTFAFCGGNPLLKSGEHWTNILDISSNYEPPIEPGKPHRVEIRVCFEHYVSNPISLPAIP